MDLDRELKYIENELRALKTAQLFPAFLQSYYAATPMPSQTYASETPYTWTIYYKNVDDTNAPLTELLASGGYWGLLRYNAANNTQQIEYIGGGLVEGGIDIEIVTSRPIDRIVRNF